MDEPDKSANPEKPAEATRAKTIDPPAPSLSLKTKLTKTEDDDTLINVHIGNPLRRITELLEQIKKQKAFSFTLKGSIGLMGVVLTLSLIGVFGTTHALCDKGVQTHKGNVKMLVVTDTEPDHLISKIQNIIKYFSTFFQPEDNTSPRYRYILELSDTSTIHLNRGRDASFTPFKDKSVYATGNYDSCSRQLTIQTPEAIEEY